MVTDFFKKKMTGKSNTDAGKSSFSSSHICFAIKGGFGNQLFQLSCAISFAIKNEKCFSLKIVNNERKYGLSIFGVEPETCYSAKIDKDEIVLTLTNCLADKAVNRFGRKYLEPSFKYNYLPLGYEFYDGYWQSPKYFLEQSRQIKRFFSKHIPNYDRNTQDHKDETVIHVRLGDMARNSHARAVHGIRSEGYFLASLKKLSETSSYKIVTDDIEKALEYYPNLVRDSAELTSGAMLEDFSILMGAKKLVISHSTFSWWAAYLSNAKVVAPKKWFTVDFLRENPVDDLFPEDWILLDE